MEAMAGAFGLGQEGRSLPIDTHKEDILDHIRRYQVTCIHGETGCGKSTRVPEFIMEEYSQKILFGEENITPPNIVITQPRRIGASSLAKRVAEEMGEPEVGHLVGYKIGQDQNYDDLTQICYVTTGYLIELLVHRPQCFGKFTHVILDEIHERDLDADLLSLVIKLLMETEKRPKLVVMSATLQVDLFYKYFVRGHLNAPELEEPVLDQVLEIKVCSQFSVETVYLEDFYTFLMQRGEVLSEDTRRRILVTYCQFLKIDPIDLVVRCMDSAEHTKMAELAETLENIPQLKEKQLKPVDDYLNLAVSLVKATAERGGSILVFLPGVREIEVLFDMLLPYEETLHKEWKSQLLLFPLHSKVPFDDQQDCFRPPEADVCHVIMATNIAESSITLPAISVILDFGQRRTLTYDTKKRIQFLKIGWCSKASMTQRKGRTGRVCDGVCFRIMPKQFYDDRDDYDEAQMNNAPLDKLVLKVKQVGEKISPGETASELLAQTVEPPSTAKIDCAFKNLAGIGAISENDEQAEVTLLGKLCASLPLDLYLCRLVMIGVLFNQPCDAIVMAAALQGQDPFRKPTKRIIKDQKKFIKSLRRSCDSRRRFDDKSYSEAIMYRNMVKEWLTVVDRQNKTHMEETGDTAGSSFNMVKFRKTFCKENDIDGKALTVIEGLILEVAQSLLRWLPKDSPIKTKVESLMKIVPSKRKISQSLDGHLTTGWHMYMDQVDDIFCENILQLHMIIAASFVPRFLYGQVKARSGYITETILQRKMEKVQVDPSRSVVIPDIPTEVQQAEDRDVKHMIQDVSLRDEHVIRKQPDFNFRFVKDGKHLFVEFDKIEADHLVEEEAQVTDDVHVGVHYMYQFSEVPSVKDNTFAYRMKGDRYGSKRLIKLKMPQNPFKTEWNLMSYDGSPLQCRAFCDWRNPVGFVFDCALQPGNLLGVTADIRAGAGGSGEGRKSKQEDMWENGFCWAEGASLFPTYQENRLALLLMLAFVPDLNQVSFIVDMIHMAIVQVEMYDVPIPVSPKYPLTKKLLRTINKLRLRISKVFSDELAKSENKIRDDSGVEQMFERLTKELKEDEAAMASRLTRLVNKDYQKVTVCASYRSQPVSVETFVYLHPYDTEVLFKREVLEKYDKERQTHNLYSSDSDFSDDLAETLQRSLLEF